MSTRLLSPTQMRLAPQMLVSNLLTVTYKRSPESELSRPKSAAKQHKKYSGQDTSVMGYTAYRHRLG